MFQYFHEFFVALNCTFWQTLEYCDIYIFLMKMYRDNWIPATISTTYLGSRYIVMCSTLLRLIPCLAWTSSLGSSSCLGQTHAWVKLVFGSSLCSGQARARPELIFLGYTPSLILALLVLLLIACQKMKKRIGKK